MNETQVNVVEKQINVSTDAKGANVVIPTKEEAMTEIMLSSEPTAELFPRILQRIWKSIIIQVQGDDIIVPTPSTGVFDSQIWETAIAMSPKYVEDFFYAQYETVVRTALCVAHRETCNCATDNPFKFCVGATAPRTGEETKIRSLLKSHRAPT